MLKSPVTRIALGGVLVALALTLLRYVVGGWHDDLPNTIAGFGSAGVVGFAVGGYIALMTRKYGRLLAADKAG